MKTKGLPLLLYVEDKSTSA